MSRSSAAAAPETLRDRCAAIAKEEAMLREGGGKSGLDRQRKLGRLPARERIALLVDEGAPFFEVGLWAAYKMYPQWGNIAAAGAVAGIGNVHGIPCMIIANDASVKAGAFFPQTAKKLIRAQRMAFESALPIIYLVDSAGVFLPMQDEIFPDEDDFGASSATTVISARHSAVRAIMGTASRRRIPPGLCDKILMTKAAAFISRPVLVKPRSARS
jgi:acetyl-CoA carboxylase carboxyltransferase component